MRVKLFFLWNWEDLLVAAMAVCWSFAMVLVLALAALVAPCQPLFQPPSEGAHHHNLSRENSKAVMPENRIPLPGAEVKKKPSWSWNVLVGRRGRFRRLFQRGNLYVCDEQLTNCANRQQEEPRATTSSSPEQQLLDPERAQVRELLAKYHLPAQKNVHSTRFASERRMVPTGPNPLHNSNRSQVIFP